jgi:chromosome segregation and condensation protein ScpB
MQQEILSRLLREVGCADADPQWVQVVGALIFIADAPMTFARLRELLPEADASQLEQALSALFALHSCLGISLQRMGGGYIFTTAPDVAAWVRRAQGSRTAASRRRRWKRWRLWPTASR